MSAELDVLPSTSLDDIFRLHDYTPPPPGWRNYSILLAREVSASNEKGHLILHATSTVEDFLRALGAAPPS